MPAMDGEAMDGKATLQLKHRPFAQQVGDHGLMDVHTLSSQYMSTLKRQPKKQEMVGVVPCNND